MPDETHTILEFERSAMACRFGISVVGDDPVWLHRAVDEAFAEIVRLESLLSMYDHDSVLSALNRSAGGQPVHVDDEVFELLLVAGTYWEQTGGAFDPTMGPLVRLWRGWRSSGMPPIKAAIDEVRDRVGMEHVCVDVDHQTVAFDRPGMELDLGAIGKGYAVDRALEVLTDHGIEHCFVHSGTSTVAARGSMAPDADGWGLGIVNLSDANDLSGTLMLQNQASARSDQVNQHYELDGRVLGHVIDPRTGWPAPADSGILVISPSATEADALSTAGLVMGEHVVDELAPAFPDARIYRFTAAEAPWMNETTG